MRRSLVGVFVSAALVMPSAILTHSVAAAPLPLEDGAQSGAVVSPRPKNTRLKNGPVVVVMDTSGSMNEADPNAPGKTKLDTAKAAVNEILGDTSTPFGLVTYPSGPTGEPLPRVDSCESGKVVLIPDNRDFNQNSAVVNGLTADGNTPSGPALKATAHWLSQRGYRDATIVLVTDGNDNCGPDPCDVAKNISATGIDVTVHGIGLSEDEEVKKSLECVAQTTGGEAVSSVKISELKTQLERFASDAVDIEVSAPSHMSVLQNDQFIQIRVSAKDKVVSGSVLSISVKNAAGKSVLVNHSKHIALQTLRPGGQSSVFKIPVQPRPNDIGIITWNVSIRHYHKDEFGASTVGDYASAKGDITVRKEAEAISLGTILNGKNNVVVMGDSYSSGENAPPYLPGSGDEDWENRCHRSAKTHGAVLFPDATILACSGAVTADFSGYQTKDPGSIHRRIRTLSNAPQGKDSLVVKKVPPQLKALEELQEAPDLVILSIGGNDAGFADVVRKMLLFPKEINGISNFFSHIGASVPGSLSDDIAGVLMKIDAIINSEERLIQRQGKVAPILILPYPDAIRNTIWKDECAFGLSKSERELLAVFQTNLNWVIEQAVNRLNGRPIYFVHQVAGAFANTHMCSEDPPLRIASTFEGIGHTTTDTITGSTQSQELFHPTETGYYLEAQAIAKWSNNPRLADPQTFGKSPYSHLSATQYDPPLKTTTQKVRDFLGLEKRANRNKVTVLCSVPSSGKICNVIHNSDVAYLEVRSDPIFLGLVETGKHVEGLEVPLPDSLPPGDHTLVAHGIDADGKEITGEMPIYVPSVAEENAIILWFWSVVSFIMAGLFGVVTLTVWLLRRKRLKHEA